MCSLKCEVKVKVTKFCIGREELINVNKLTKFDSCIINGLWETKLNATAKRKLLTPERQTDRQTGRQFSPIHRPDLLCNLVKKRSFFLLLIQISWTCTGFNIYILIIIIKQAFWSLLTMFIWKSSLFQIRLQIGKVFGGHSSLKYPISSQILFLFFPLPILV